MVGFNSNFDWQTFGGNALQDLGYGLSSSPTLGGALGQATQRNVQLSSQRAADAKQRQQTNATVTYLRAKFPQLADAVENGGMSLSDAWSAALAPAPGPIKVGKDDTLLDPVTMKPVYTPSAASARPDPQPGMMWNPDGATQSPIPGSKEAFDREQAQVQQYQATDPVKTFQVVRNGYQKIRSAAQSGTGAGDVSMIFAYMKMLDPTSVVREGEFATAQNAGGVTSTVANLYNSVLNGQKLPPELRKQFLSEADKIYKSSADNLSALNQTVTGRAKQWGVNPDDFLVQPDTFEPLSLGGGTSGKTASGIGWSLN